MNHAKARAENGWPHMSVTEVEAQLCRAGRFEVEDQVIDGIPTRVWKNAVPDMAAVVRHAGTHGEGVFLILDDERLSYVDFARAVAALASELVGLGVEKGDRVAVAMRNLPEWPVCFFAAASIGAIAVPLNAWWTGAELEFALRDSGARIVLCDAPRAAAIEPFRCGLPMLEHVIVARDDAGGAGSLERRIGAVGDYGRLPVGPIPDVSLAPDEDVAIFYTSGTTGAPKGAVATHRNLLSNILSTAYASARTILRRGQALPAPRRRTALHVIPFFHVTGFSARLLGAMFSGDTLVLMHKWDTERAFALIEREGIDSAGGVPTIAWQLIEHPARARYDLSSLDLISYGGAPAAPELARRIATEFGAAPGVGWGMTETCGTVTNHSGEDYLARPDSCGPAVAVAELKIAGDDGAALPTGTVGELWARGPMVVRRYWNRPDATTATFVDGWVRTGDIARLDEEGFCYIVDRAKDVIIRGGENIYSSEVENVLFEFPGVTDAALIGLPDRVLGEVPAAVVHLAADATGDEEVLRQWVRDHLAAFKVPVAIRFSDETLPRNANGKILKPELRRFFDDYSISSTPL
ncbi:class I adenylate-forming enzyme family protein [Sphingopyxis sp.]|uniref:class I adenylate-forming enzyme family protein n=1 Tax=Sphingopyxis sp. TaxID=1908224 RepID=UPI0039C8CD13